MCYHYFSIIYQMNNISYNGALHIEIGESAVRAV